MTRGRELWLEVSGFPDYEVSNLGRVRRVGSEAVLKPSRTHGYLHVSLCRESRAETIRVHVAVLSAFCGQAPFPGAHAAHNDGDKENCRLTNLRWATPVENQKDVERHGRRCRGEIVFGAKLSEQSVRKIRELINAGFRNPPIARQFGVTISTIHLIRHRKTWRHVGG